MKYLIWFYIVLFSNRNNKTLLEGISLLCWNQSPENVKLAFYGLIYRWFNYFIAPFFASPHFPCQFNNSKQLGIIHQLHCKLESMFWEEKVYTGISFKNVPHVNAWQIYFQWKKISSTIFQKSLAALKPIHCSALYYLIHTIIYLVKLYFTDTLYFNFFQNNNKRSITVSMM